MLHHTPTLVRAWTDRMFLESEREMDGELAPIQTLDWDDAERRFWDAWAKHPTALSIVNDVMFFFHPDVPDSDVFSFDVCGPIMEKGPLIEIARAEFWTVKAGESAGVGCKESFAFTGFKADAAAPRQKLAFAVLKSFYQLVLEKAPLTDEDAAFCTARIVEFLEHRKAHAPDDFQRNLAQALWDVMREPQPSENN